MDNDLHIRKLVVAEGVYTLEELVPRVASIRHWFDPTTGVRYCGEPAVGPRVPRGTPLAKDEVRCGRCRTINERRHG